MTKYRMEDLKVGAVFKNGSNIRTIVTVGKTDVFYSYHGREGHREYSAQFYCFLNGTYGKLIVPNIKTKKIKTKKGTMAWALVQLVKGLKVRHKSWDSSKYIDLAKYSDHGGWLPLITWGRNAAGWELYEEKEEKIK